MSASTKRVLFIDRDGGLLATSPDAVQKFRLTAGVIPALATLRNSGYTFVMVSNQGRADAAGLPALQEANGLLRELLVSQGVGFDGEFICSHLAEDDCTCRMPRTGLVDSYLHANAIDLSNSYAVGEKATILEFARNLGVQGILLSADHGDRATWADIAKRLAIVQRIGRIERRTKETQIAVEVDLDQESPIQVSTGLGFFDHMLEQLAKHGGFSLRLSCAGDLHIDEHHTVEDCALSLGQALKTALGDKRGVQRYGFLLPMDEALAQVAIDLSGRPYFVFEGRFGRDQVGQLPTELVPHFFRSLAESLGAAINLKVTGENTHHMIEACFKGVGRALRQAIRITDVELPSTKGVL